MSKSRPPRRHHRVPRFYLRRFAVDDQVIAVPRSDPSKKIVMSTADASVRADFYTVDGVPKEKAHAVESFLAQFESAAAPAIKRMVEPSGFPPPEAERAVVAAFMAFQFVRGQSRRDVMDDGLEHTAKLALCMLKPEPLLKMIRAKLGHEPSQAEVNAWVKAMDPSSIGAFFPRGEHIRTMLEVAPAILQIFSDRNWQLLRFSDPLLLTGDEPIAVLWRGGTTLMDAKNIFLPLDPKHLLMLSDDPDGGVADGDPRIATGIVNPLVANQAYEWMFHSPEHSPIAGLRIPPRPPMVVSGLGVTQKRKRR